MKTIKIRHEFPLYLNQPQLVYLDSAASSFKHEAVIEKISMYNKALGVNVHRGGYQLAYEATKLYEDARKAVARLINANPDEVIFTRGTTSSLNTIAHAYRSLLGPNDEIITSELEHHSSLLPWMKTAQVTGAKLVYIPLTKEGRITVEGFKKVINSRSKVVAITHVSNVMGYESPIEEIIKIAHAFGAVVVLDAAQSVPHMKVDVKKLNVDYLAFSGHKMFGPTSVGILYGKLEHLEKIEPFEYGGEMIDKVYKNEMRMKSSPLKFEAGTPVISGAIAMKEAVEFIEKIGYDALKEHTHHLHQYTLEKIKQIPGITVYNKTAEHPIITFNIEGIHPHDVTTVLDQYGVCVRAGHHCAQLVTQFLNVPATLRASFQIYNTIEDCDRFVDSLVRAKQFFDQFEVI